MSSVSTGQQGTDRQRSNTAATVTRFQKGDLIEYTNPDTGDVYRGRVVVPYTVGPTSDEHGNFTGFQAGYGCTYIGFGDQTYFARAGDLRLLVPACLVAPRADTSFRAFVSSLSQRPRRSRIPNGAPA